MLKRFSPLAVVPILLGVIAVANAQADSQQTATTQYERFLKRTDVVIVTQSYPLPNLPGSENIRNTQRIIGVFLSGRYFPKQTLQRMLADAEGAAKRN